MHVNGPPMLPIILLIKLFWHEINIVAIRVVNMFVSIITSSKVIVFEVNCLSGVNIWRDFITNHFIDDYESRSL